MARCCVALGSNLGDRMENLRGGILGLRRFMQPLGLSNVYETSPVGCPAGSGDYLNMVAVFDCGLTAEAALHAMLEIEGEMGRVRPEGVVNAPRTLDLDLLDFGQEAMSTPFLTLPHPRMSQRLFVQRPLREVAKELGVSDIDELEKAQACRLYAPWFRVCDSLTA